LIFCIIKNPLSKRKGILVVFLLFNYFVMILSDSAIFSRLEKWDLKFESNWKYDTLRQVWPASLDFRLWNTFKFYKRDNLTVIDPKNQIDEKKHVSTVVIPDWEAFILHPRQFVLWVTLEKIKIPNDLVARCEWRSSLWRLWVIIHSTAWFIDPWFEGTITLEITNINEIPIALYPWMRIWQFAFETVLWDVINTYDKRVWSKYNWQIEPTISKVNLDLY